MFANVEEIGHIGWADLVLRTTRPALTTIDHGATDMAIPTQARLRALFNYDPATGCLIWRDRPQTDFKSAAAFHSFKSRFAGKVAGHIEAQGYRVIVCEGRAWKAHRLVWLFVIGEWVKYPSEELDHVNGDRSDNRIQNLRKTTKSGNQRNGSMRVNNSSGVNGVNWVTSKRRWVARIWDGPRHRYLGQFRNIEDAAAARAKAERDLGYHPGHGKPSKAQ